MTKPTTKQQLHLSYDVDAPFPPAFNERMDTIAALGLRRDAILNAPEFDIEKARALVLAYETAKMPSCAEDLRKRVEYYEEGLKVKE